LVHFMLVGALAYAFLYDGSMNSDSDIQSEIIISAKDQQRTISAWHKQWGRPPTDLEFQDSLEAEIRQRILYREAKALNLHIDDPIIQRRMVQKLEYVLEASGMPDEPIEADLLKWFAENRGQYKAPTRINFEQVFFDIDKRPDALGDATRALSQISDGAIPDKFGDQIFYPHQKTAMDGSAIKNIFGKEFASKLLKIRQNHWVGPITSGIGIHLVKVNKLTEGQDVELADVRQKVLNDYMYARRKQILESQYQGIKGKYIVRIEAQEGQTESKIARQTN